MSDTIAVNIFALAPLSVWLVSLMTLWLLIGAKIYYLRNILHDNPDEQAVKILKNLVAAFGPGSTILIDEMALPNTGAHWQACQLDITMMSAVAALERTKDQWYDLIEKKAGLKIRKIYQYSLTLQDSIIEVVLP